jgi:Domain of Unknown Function (DUF748)
MNVLSTSRTLRLVLLSLIGAAIVLSAAFFWLSRNLTSLVESSLRRTYGPELSLGRIETDWHRVILHDIHLKRTGGGPVNDRISIGRVIMTPRFRALLSRRLEIDLLRLENPRLLIEVSPDGSLMSPLASASTASGSGGPALSLAISRIEINKGEIIFLDRSTDRLRMPGVSNRSQGFHLLQLTDIWFHTGPLEIPFKAAPLPVTLFLSAPGPGTLRVNGTFSPVTLDTNLEITLRHWDLTRFRPYYLKPDSLNVTGGFLDGDATLSISAKKLHVPGEIRIKGLELERTGKQGAFLGMSAKAFLAAMKDDKGEIATTFLLDGDLSNPRFKARQSLVEQIGGGMARKLGVPVISDVGSGIINLGKKGISGIRSLFGGGK